MSLPQDDLALQGEEDILGLALDPESETTETIVEDLDLVDDQFLLVMIEGAEHCWWRF